MILAGIYSIVIGLCIAAAGALLGMWLGDLAFRAGLFKPNADIDDDAAIISMGFAMGGAMLGFLVGTITGWRVISSRVVRR
jgi:hypothetical protein